MKIEKKAAAATFQALCLDIPMFRHKILSLLLLPPGTLRPHAVAPILETMLMAAIRHYPSLNLT